MLRALLISIASIAMYVAICTTASSAEEIGKIDQEAAEFAAELIGRPVFSIDGTEVGTVADLALDDTGTPYKLRMTTGSRLGIGARTIEIPSTSFMTLRGAVVVDLPASEVASLPDARDSDEER